jgi:uncharacterized protein
MNVVSKSCTAFKGHHWLASGAPHQVALAVKTATENGTLTPIFIFDDATGAMVDFNMQGTADQVAARLQPIEDTAVIRGRGRPKLGVIAREVTLLPRHWDWLNTQPGGASVALRKLVEEARRASGGKDRQRAAQEAAYRFMTAMAGDFPGFEEASRALFAYDRRKFADLVSAWPEDVRDHAIRLAFSDLEKEG